MNKQSILSTLVLALGLLSLSGLAQARADNDEAKSTSARSAANEGNEKHARKGNKEHASAVPKGHSYGRCKPGKRNKHCASPS